MHMQGTGEGKRRTALKDAVKKLRISSKHGATSSGEAA